VSQPFLVSNGGKSVSAAIARSAATAGEIELAVAYLSNADLIEIWLRRGSEVKLLVALQPPTDPRVLRHLLNSFPVGLQLRFYSARFHSKLLIFSNNRKAFCAQVGSSNFTGGGLFSNIETNVLTRKPAQLTALADHFKSIWKGSALLQPVDLDAYEKYWQQTKADRDRLKARDARFEKRVVLPRIHNAGSGRVFTEARDYYGFWNVVDDVVRTIAPVSRREWPGIPLYRTVDHFFHWIVQVWDRRNLYSISKNPKVRARALPQLFADYARWDKSNSNFAAGKMIKSSRLLRRLLSRKNLPKLSRRLAQDVYRRLHSGYMRTRRFSSDAAFVRQNSITEIRRTLGYLLWSNDDIDERISACLPRGRLHLAQFGASNVQELLGWVNPDTLPLRNDKADKALELLGYRFR
jgi:HKD family nuclease